FRDPQLDITRGRGEYSRPVAVAFGDTVLGALIGGGADPFGRFELDQLLQRDADRIPDQIDAVTGAERLKQLGQGRLGQGHRWSPSGACLARTHRRSRRWPPTSCSPAVVPSNPTTPRDSYRRVDGKSWRLWACQWPRSDQVCGAVAVRKGAMEGDDARGSAVGVASATGITGVAVSGVEVGGAVGADVEVVAGGAGPHIVAGFGDQIAPLGEGLGPMMPTT